jgi:NADH:ubiquinone oxidoreductase subunit 2 (subunit N)
MGFILLALSAVSVYSLSTAIFYIFTYIFMNMGIWTASIIYAVNYQTTEINDYKGLFYKNPYFTIAFIICLISFAGLPPTSGFISKLYIYSTLLRVDYFYLLILFVALFATIICFYVYFKIIKVFFDTKENNNVVAKKIFSSKFILYFCSFILIVMGLFPNKIIKLAEIIAYYI